VEIQINDLKINYIKEGPDTKTTILFLHGWGTSAESFRPVINEMAKKFTTYAIDFPGFGSSQQPPTTYEVEDYSKLVLEFINKLNLENVVLVGHSFGGRVIIKLVGKLGYKPKKIILVDSAGIKPKRTLKYKIKVGVFKFAKKIAMILLGKKKGQEIINKYRSKAGSTDYNNADAVMKEVFKNVVNEDLTEYLPNIKVPTLLIWGELDQDTPLSDAQKMEQLIDNAGLVVIKGAGHFSFLNNLPYFLVVVNKFLEGCE